MHSLSWLASNGAAAIVCFPGVMYRGGAEQKIRKYLIDNNFVDCIIQLPDNLFYGSSKTTGTDIDKILPAVSRFGGGGSNRKEKKETVIEKLKGFFERFWNIG